MLGLKSNHVSKRGHRWSTSTLLIRKAVGAPVDSWPQWPSSGAAASLDLVADMNQAFQGGRHIIRKHTMASKSDEVKELAKIVVSEELSSDKPGSCRKGFPEYMFHTMSVDVRKMQERMESYKESLNEEFLY